MKFIDICAGIGGMRLGLEQSGMKCVGFCEYDKFAVKSYCAMHGAESEWYHGDATTLTQVEIPEADLWSFGFPCQDVSVAGKRAGMSEGTRSGIFFAIIEAAKKHKPEWLVAENVMGLLNHDGGKTFARVLLALDGAGYDAQWYVYNTKDFGVPQNRERVYIVGHLRACGGCAGEVLCDRGESNPTTLEALNNGLPQGYRVYGNGGLSTVLSARSGGLGANTGLYMIPGTINNNKFVDRCGKPALALTATMSKGLDNRGARTAIAVLAPDKLNKRQNDRTFKIDGEPMFTITAMDRHGVYDGSRIRRLTPKECFRLQGFPDDMFYKAKSVNSDSQLYKQAGNAVSVPVAKHVGDCILTYIMLGG